MSERLLCLAAELSALLSSSKYLDGKDGTYDAAHWRYALQRPDFLPTGDGPYGLEGWPALCFGRVVGIYEPMSTQIRIDVSGLPARVLDRRDDRML